jgi:predicted AlkP superfamily phosphohydrolase/phosphomutase
VLHFSAWPTIYTGTYPGDDGVYHAIQIRAGEQKLHALRPHDCAHPPFWKFLDEAGRRCIVMDAFIGYPLADFNGVQVFDYGTWRWFSSPGAAPGAVWKELNERCGRYPGLESMEIVRRPDPLRFRDRLIAAAEVKGKAARWLMQNYPWDMCFVTFSEMHSAGHHLWHVDDREHPAHAAAEINGIEHALRDVYGAVDAALGELLGIVGDSITVVVTSGDGMGPNYRGYHLMPDVLNRLGLLHFNSSRPDYTDANPSRIRKSALSMLREAIPLSMRRALVRCIPRDLRQHMYLHFALDNVDWDRTRAFCIPSDNEGFIRLNLTGREPWGRVDATAVQRLLAELQDDLLGLVNPDNGRAAVGRVDLAPEVFPGDRQQDLPDVVVGWDPDARVNAALQSERCGFIHKCPPYELNPFYTGNHRPNAFVMARGKRIDEASTIEDGHIVDLAPTILAMLGVVPPAHMLGRALRGLIG